MQHVGENERLMKEARLIAEEERLKKEKEAENAADKEEEKDPSNPHGTVEQRPHPP